MARVSIVTPAYNAGPFVGETLAAIGAQTFADWELLVADDGSTDDTRDIVAAAAARDRRIRLLVSAGNTGPARARQLALDHAGGRYIAFCDSDDFWLPEKLAKQLAFMDQHRAALSYTGFRRINEDGTRTGRLMPIPASLSYRQLLKNTAIATSTAIVDRDIAGPIAMTDAGYDDFVLWLGILKRGHTAHGLPQDLMRYRVRGNSVSSRPGRSAGWVWHIYRQVEGLSLPDAAWCLANYGARAWLKRQAF